MHLDYRYYYSLHVLCYSEWMVAIWTRVVNVMGLTSDPLSNLLYLSDQLEKLAVRHRAVSWRRGLADMWVCLAQRFSKCVTEVSG